MHTIRYDDKGFKERVTGEYSRAEDILVGPELTDACIAATVRMKRGFETEVHAHSVEEQIFIVLDGTGEITIEDEKKEINKGMTVYVPKKVDHKIIATSEELVYVYITVWTKGKPDGITAKICKEGKVTNIKYSA